MFTYDLKVMAVNEPVMYDLKVMAVHELYPSRLFHNVVEGDTVAVGDAASDTSDSDTMSVGV